MSILFCNASGEMNLAGSLGISGVSVTPDGRAYAYNHIRILSELYVLEGVR